MVMVKVFEHLLRVLLVPAADHLRHRAGSVVEVVSVIEEIQAIVDCL